MIDNNDIPEVIYAIGESGEEVKYDVLFTCQSDDGTKDYIVYTDNSVDEEGNTRVYASTYQPNVENSVLLPIEDDAEWRFIEAAIAEIQAAVNEEDEQ